MGKTISCPHGLPVILHEGERYFVDTHLREFRSAVYPPEMIDVVGFDTERGCEMLAEVALRECSECRKILVEAMEDESVLCPRCGGELRFVHEGLGWL